MSIRVRSGRLALMGWIVLLTLLMSGLSAALEWQLRPNAGLTRIVFPEPGFSGTPLDRTTARTIDLSLLDQNPSLPRRLFSIRWSGIWHVRSSQVYDVFLGADDRATLTIDGQRVLERSPQLGMSTTSTAVSLDAGFHTIDVDYEQDRGGVHLNLQVAPAGKTPAPVDPYALFPTEPTEAMLWLSTIAKAARRAVGLGWLALLGAVVWLVGTEVAHLGRSQPGGWPGVWERCARRARDVLPRLRRMSPMWCVGLPLLVVLYAAMLRLDALVARYGPLEQPGWAQTLQVHASERWIHWRPQSLGWRPVAEPYVGGDPINYIRFAREMEFFYDAHVREPVFPFVTKVFLRLLNQQDVAVSFASAFFSILCVWATWLLGSYAFSRWVGLGAALAMAIDRQVISWGINGWRDDAFTFFVIFFAYTVLRCHRDTTHANAVFAGTVAGLACLTRITALSFLIPGFVMLAFASRAEDASWRVRTVGLAVLTMTVVAAPFLINCWREFGDPFYTINYHTEFYQMRAGVTPEADLSAANYIGAMIMKSPFATLSIMVEGLTTYPFLNKWTGFDPWFPGLGRWLSWSALVGLVLLFRSPHGRFLLIVLVTSLLPYAFTWNIQGGAEWRLTEHAYPFFLIAAAWAPVFVAQAMSRAAMRWTVWHGRHDAAGPGG